MKFQENEIIIGEINDKTIFISPSKLKCRRQCDKKGDYKYNQKLIKKGKAAPLYRGTLIHSCIEEWYKGNDYKQPLEDALLLLHEEVEKGKLFNEEFTMYKDIIEECRRIMRGYVVTWKQVDKDWIIHGTELAATVLIPGTNIAVVVRIDEVIEDNMGIWALENKTHKNLPNEEYRLLDIQSAIYCWALPIVLKQMGLDASKFQGLIFNYVRTKPPTIPDILKNGTLSKRKIDTDRATIIATCKENGLDPHDYMDMIKAADGREYFDRHRLSKSPTLITNVLKDAITTASVFTQLKHFPRNPGLHCGWGCEYKELCIAEMYGHDSEFLRKSMYEIKNVDLDAEKEGGDQNGL